MQYFRQQPSCCLRWNILGEARRLHCGWLLWQEGQHTVQSKGWQVTWIKKNMAYWRIVFEISVEYTPLSPLDNCPHFVTFWQLCLFFNYLPSVQQYKLLDDNAAAHRWYYFSRLQKDEVPWIMTTVSGHSFQVLLFKQWDSDPNLSGRVCFHTSFHDDNAPPCPSRLCFEKANSIHKPII